MKLCSAVSSLGLIGIMACGGAFWYARTLGEELNVATQKTAVKIDTVNAARARSWEMVAALRGEFINASLKHHEEADANARRFDAAFNRIGEQVALVRPLLSTEQSRRDIARFESGLAEFNKVAEEYKRLCREGKFAQVSELIPKVQSFGALADETLSAIENTNRSFLTESQTRAEALRTQSIVVNILVSSVLLAILAAAILVVRGITRTLSAAVSELSEGAEQVSAAAGQVSASSQSLAQGSSEQAASLQETSASSEEINSMAQRNTEHSGAAANLVTSSQQKFSETNQSLEEMVGAMAEIKSSSDKISKIIKTIDEIAFQTNILALNAAVEAARAGEAGMGFAVVADEVRNLAQRCAQAAKDTAGLIEECITKSNDGKEKVDQVAVAIRAITAESAKVKTLVDEVNLGSQEQARGIEQIGKAISQMEQVTQKTAANAEESASAAEELNAQSETLRDIVERLTAMVGQVHSEEATRRPGPAAGRHSPATQHGARDSHSELAALRTAVARKPVKGKMSEPVLAGGKPDRNALPLEEEFTEF